MLSIHLLVGCCVQKPCNQHSQWEMAGSMLPRRGAGGLNPRWQQWAVCRDAGPGAGAWAAQLHPICQNSTPSPPPPSERQKPYKVAPPTATQESKYSNVCPFFDRGIKLSLASEPNLVSFYWLEPHWAGRPLLGSSSKGSERKAVVQKRREYGKQQDETAKDNSEIKWLLKKW